MSLGLRIGRYLVIACAFVPLACALVIRTPGEPPKPQPTSPGAVVTIAPPGTYSVDALIVDGRQFPPNTPAIVVRRGHTVAIAGWALNPRTFDSGTALTVRIDNGPLRQLSGYGMNRPDVAAALGDADAAQSGFRSDIPLNGLRPGPHHLRLTLITGRDRRTIIPTLIHLVLVS